MYTYKKLLLATIIAIGSASSLQGQVQNHLRPETVNSQNHRSPSRGSDQPATGNFQNSRQVAPISENENQYSVPETPPIDQETKTKHDHLINRILDGVQAQASVEPAAHELPAEEFVQSLAELKKKPEEEKPVELSATQENRAKLQDVAEKIIYNTLIVLSVGIGFVFAAKLFLKPKKAPVKNSKQADFNILSNMKLASKVNLFLIGVADARLVVATDPSGVKSVVRLSESFAETLGGMEAEDAPTSLPTNSELEPESTYSLSSFGNSVSREREPEVKPEDVIRRKMESALAEHGLKDLFLDSLRKG